MNHRLPRGLTLVEVVAATILLAMLAAAAVPLIRDIARSAQTQPPGPALEDLAAAADAILAQPARVGLSQHQLSAPALDREVIWPLPADAAENSHNPAPRPVIRVRTIAPHASHDSQASLPRCYLAFSAGDATVIRFVPLARTQPMEPAP